MTRLPYPAFAVVLLTALFAAMSCSDGGDDNPGPTDTPSGAAGSPTANETETAADPEDALGLWVQRRLSLGFVADCEDARRPDDIGKQCARRAGERGEMVAYEVGPTFSEYSMIFVLRQEAGVWTIVSQVARDPVAPDVPGIPWPLEIGAEVVVAGTDACLRVRDRPEAAAPEVACLNDGEPARIIGGPIEADDNEWWQLEHLGWASGTYLRYPDEAPTPEEDEG